MFQISHGGLILLRNVKPEESEEIVEPVVGMYTSMFIFGSKKIVGTR